MKKTMYIVLFILFGLSLSAQVDTTSSDTDALRKQYKAMQVAVLKGKKLSIMGNSISTMPGYIPKANEPYYPKGEVTDVSHTWWGKLIAETGMMLDINNSWSGSRVALGGKDDNRVPMSDESRLSNLGDPDVIIFWGGINDFGYNVPLGSVEDAIKNTDDRSTFANAYFYTLKELRKRYPRAVLFACTPLERARYKESPTYPVRRDDGTYLYEFANVIRELCNIQGVYCIDLFNGVNINYFNSNQAPQSVGMSTNLYTIDGLHPNRKGMEIVKNYMINSILNVF